MTMMRVWVFKRIFAFRSPQSDVEIEHRHADALSMKKTEESLLWLAIAMKGELREIQEGPGRQQRREQVLDGHNFPHAFVGKRIVLARDLDGQVPTGTML